MIVRVLYLHGSDSKPNSTKSQSIAHICDTQNRRGHNCIFEEITTFKLPYETRVNLLIDKIKFIEKNHPEDPIILVGTSMGAAVVTEALFITNSSQIKALMLLVPASPIRYNATFNHQNLKKELPVWIVAGSDDSIVTTEESSQYLKWFKICNYCSIPSKHKIEDFNCNDVPSILRRVSDYEDLITDIIISIYWEHRNV